eukprot:Phypoly_transcript_01540.p1 GENE.Phypoly_transcript_01540~~Phypoly_transcript_01540.p1  ORF type:complete len:1069 (+),score=95.14 Phypoly_transcript_01540:45-3251(+)
MPLGTPWVHQGLLLHRVRSIFPNHHTLENVKKQSNLRYPSGAYLELDAWIPELNICFEFQDPYHYITAWFSHITKARVQAKDNIKIHAVRQQEITLITVPCWWDGTVESLYSTIHFERPDLLPLSDDAHPIPLCPKVNFFKAPLVPEVGELMQASFPVDANFNYSIQPNTWWVGEKYDGMRCCWNPQRQKIYTRAGRELQVLPGIARLFPKIYIDGEFCFGRGLFAFTYMLVKAAFDFVCWDLLRLISFDTPARNLRKKTFEERYKRLLSYVSLAHPFNIVATRIMCKNSKHLNTLVQGVIDDEGEGVIMRKVGSLYENGRSPNLIKLKTSFGDQEGIIAGIKEDGTVLLKLPNGQTIAIAPQDVLIPTPPVGSVVTFSYESNARRDDPVHPQIFRLRSDLQWEDVVYNAIRDKKYLSGHLRTAGFTSRPPGYWTPKNMRLFMESFAKSKNLDPLLPETWYKISPREFLKLKSGGTVARKFSGYFKTLRALFPNVPLDPKLFPQPKWHDIGNRRKFFEEYAAEKEFNSQIAENWYSQNIHSIMAKKGIYSVIAYHKHLPSQALMDLFPNIGLVKSRFWGKVPKPDVRTQINPDPVDYPQIEQETQIVRRHATPISWRDTATRRIFFENYAASVGFDPLVAEMWYLQPTEKIMSARGAAKVIRYHKDSIAQALYDLFPHIGINPNKFQQQLWHIVEYRRDFFVQYAYKSGFDPLVASNWHAQSKQALLSLNDVQSVLSYHKGSISQALLELFPNIGLDKSTLYTKSLWNEASDRRNFFEEYAKANGFDPLTATNWYRQSRERIMAVQGAHSVLNYHRTLSQALVDLFPDIGLEKSKLWDRFSWSNVENRRAFFKKYAEENGFDPLVADHWYSQPYELVMSVKGAFSVVYYHHNNLTRALQDLFPSVNLDASKLWDPGLWSDPKNRRKFFENYARSHDFDPEVAKNWYSQPKDKIIGMKGISSILRHHKDSLSQAMLDLFPSVEFDKSKLWDRPTFRSVCERKKFFEDYARKNNFDPKVPERWHTQPLGKIFNAKGASKILHYHNNSLPQALKDLFPDIEFDARKFSVGK